MKRIAGEPGQRPGGRLLVVEDEQAQAASLERLLRLEGHEVDVCGAGGAALERLRGGGYELVLCDLRLPDMDGLSVFHRVREALGDEAPTFTILTAYGTVEAAREALKAGVYDFLTKPVHSTDLGAHVRKVLEKRRLRRENQALSQAVSAERAEDRLVGAAPAFLEMIALAKAAAASEATILIRGESGTGKELIAELIHETSPRALGPFVKVNCAAIPEGLLEAELFGHERGAFTDARRGRKGRFELAQGGTIFLDEVGDMGPALQVKLLRVLQERELERLGGQGRVIALDFRLVAATNRDLEAMVRAGEFREDLYYRVNVIGVEVPPLRERPGDVELLARHFCRRLSGKNQKPVRSVSAAALERLRAHDWPGNVRELENAIERAVVMGQGDELLPEHLAAFGHAARGAAGAGPDLPDLVLDAGVPLAELERELLRQAYDRAEGDAGRAAAALGITRRALVYRLGKRGQAVG